MDFTILFERKITDISFEPSLGATPPTQPPVIKHLLKNPTDEKALCGYLKGSGDTLESDSIDPGSIDCTKCANEAAKPE